MKLRFDKPWVVGEIDSGRPLKTVAIKGEDFYRVVLSNTSAIESDDKKNGEFLAFLISQIPYMLEVLQNTEKTALRTEEVCASSRCGVTACYHRRILDALKRYLSDEDVATTTTTEVSVEDDDPTVVRR